MTLTLHNFYMIECSLHGKNVIISIKISTLFSYEEIKHRLNYYQDFTAVFVNTYV